MGTTLSEQVQELARQNEQLKRELSTPCGSCGKPTTPAIRVCECGDAWIGKGGAEFMDRAQAPLQARIKQLEETLRELLDACTGRAAELVLLHTYPLRNNLLEGVVREDVVRIVVAGLLADARKARDVLKMPGKGGGR
jgi:hypothetical protein